VPLSDADRATVVDAAVDLLRHRDRRRLMKILEDRIRQGDYPGEHEQDLDRVALALARAIDAQLGDEGT
jgi:hypothetical protein